MCRWYIGLSIAVAWSALFFIGIGPLGLGSEAFKTDLLFLLLAPAFAAVFVCSGCTRVPKTPYLLLSIFLFFWSGFVLGEQLSVDTRSIVVDIQLLIKVSIALLFHLCALIFMIRQSRGRRRRGKK